MCPARNPHDDHAGKPSKTGPKTEIGKARSSRNSLKHGIFSRNILIPGERAQDYNKLLNGLFDAHQPQGMAEQILVEKIAVTTWKLRRLNKVETADITNRMTELSRRYDDVDAFAVPVNLDKLLRYQNQLETQYYRALITLQQLQANRHKIIEAEVIPENS